MLHQCGYGGGVIAAGQQGAEPDICHHAGSHGVVQQLLQRIGGLVQRAGEWIVLAGECRLCRRPVALHLLIAAGAYAQPVARGQFVYVLEYGAGPGYPGVLDKQGQRIVINAGVEVGVGTQGLQFRAKQESLRAPAIVQRLFSNPVAGQHQRLVPAVPQGEGEHALEAAQCGIDAPLGDGGKHDLRIGVAAKMVTQGLQLSAQRREIVDLAVVAEHVAAID